MVISFPYSTACPAACSAPGNACSTVCGPPYTGGACGCSTTPGCGENCQTCPDCAQCCCSPPPSPSFSNGISYRYFTGDVLWPFGFGLSYTQVRIHETFYFLDRIMILEVWTLNSLWTLCLFVGPCYFVDPCFILNGVELWTWNDVLTRVVW